MKYILKKEYPGSPKLGNIIDNLENDWIENYPEFWEKVVEKDYEILSLARFCSIKPTITDVSYYGDEYIEALLKCDNARIHSVKRKDGEIFTIGDIVTNKGEIINEFEIIDNKLKVWFIHPSYSCPSKPKNNRSITGCGNMNFNWLKNIVKVKKPLCTTEDGVDIYLGNKSWILHKNSWYLSPAAIVHNNSNWTPNENEAHWRFSTKEKAEEYILLNKPCLSYDDVQEYLKVKDCNKVLDLAQSKIQQSV